MSRKIAVATGTRAEFGSLYWVLREIQDSADLELRLLVTGAHLVPAFGHTVSTIREEFSIAAEIDTLMASDTKSAVGKSIAMGVFGFTDALSRLGPDLLLLIADRSETFAAAVAAVALGIPIAHISGGEATEGLMDDQFRHAITKMSHLHFVSNDFYRGRVIGMGENPSHVHAVGEPGLDHCRRSKLLDRDKISKATGLDFSQPVAVVSFHPVTLELEQTQSYVHELLVALDSYPDLQLLFTYPGADPSSRLIIEALERYVSARSNAVIIPNLGSQRYLSALKNATLMIGNSSSGIWESPSFALPVVNIGTRQAGRMRAQNVIDVGHSVAQIVSGIDRALDPKFRSVLADLRNPYGDGDASRQIVHILKTVNLNELKYKPFFDSAATVELRR